jgi:N-acetylglucosaminyl-diphospho-decaprenol L-rhamnosyltransferase
LDVFAQSSLHFHYGAHLNPDISILIVNYNTCAMLRECLEAIPAATKDFSYAIFVWDNASSDGSVEMIREGFPEVRLVESRSNLGFARANNRLMEMTDPNYYLLLNPDTIPRPGSISELKRFLDSHSDAGACGPMLLHPDGSLQTNGGDFPAIRDDYYSLFAGRTARMRRKRDDYNTICEVDQVSGACLMVKNEVVRNVGGMNEIFFLFSEEVEWCHRIKKAGYKVFYVPEAKVVHHWMGSVRKDSRRMARQYLKSRFLYYRLTGGWAYAALALPALALGLIKSELLHIGSSVKRALRS